MRRLALVLAPAALLAACGSAAPVAHGPTPRVTIRLTAPSDAATVRAGTVQVSGAVTPSDATVAVEGRSASVDGGTFSATVPLEPGGNVIDVTASSPGRRATAAAVRVTRDIRVRVPDLQGFDESDAETALANANLTADEENVGSFLDRFIPTAVQVCDTQPAAGSLVTPRSRVVLEVAHEC